MSVSLHPRPFKSAWFAKQHRANIDEGELRVFREIARAYAGITQAQADAQVTDGHWIEICAGELEQRS